MGLDQSEAGSPARERHRASCRPWLQAAKAAGAADFMSTAPSGLACWSANRKFAGAGAGGRRCSTGGRTRNHAGFQRPGHAHVAELCHRQRLVHKHVAAGRGGRRGVTPHCGGAAAASRAKGPVAVLARAHLHSTPSPRTCFSCQSAAGRCGACGAARTPPGAAARARCSSREGQAFRRAGWRRSDGCVTS